jgi:hypothetical protein
MWGVNEGTHISSPAGSAGFTLLELVLATLISSLVIAIVSVSLGFSLRVWEKSQGRQPDDLPSLVELLNWQLANFDPVQIKLDVDKQLVFQGDEQSIAFTTDRSVRALSNGVPIIARYIYLPQEKKIYYAEIPLDPYHPEVVKAFLQMKPGDRKSRIRFYPTQVDSFIFSFTQGDDRGGDMNTWDDSKDIPQSVTVTWSRDNGATVSSRLIVPNFFFAKKLKENQGLSPSGSFKTEQSSPPQ